MACSGPTLGSNTFSGSTLAGSTLGGNQSTNIGSSQAAIDLNHLRPTTKYDQLTKDLQTEIENLDNAINNELNKANEIPLAIEKVATTGEVIPQRR